MNRKLKALNKSVVLCRVVSEVVTHAIQFQQSDKYQAKLNPIGRSNLDGIQLLSFDRHLHYPALGENVIVFDKPFHRI